MIRFIKNSISRHSWYFESSKNVIQLFFLALCSAVHFISSLCDDEFVFEYLPSIVYPLGLRGFSRKITEFAICLANAFCIAVILLFSSPKTKRDITWQLDPLMNIEFVNSFSKLKLDTIQLKKLKARIVSVKKLAKISVILGTASVTFSSTVIPVLFIFPNYPKPIWFQFFVIASISPVSLIAINLFINQIAAIYTAIYYFRLRIKKVDNFLKLMKAFRKLNKQILSRFLTMHSSVCKDIVFSNQIWKIFYFCSLIFLLPSNLFFLHTMLFGNMPYFVFIGTTAAIIITAVYIFAISFWLADVSFSVHKLRIKTYYLLVNNNQNLSLRSWIKLITCFERMSVKNKKIGFTCLSIFTITYTSVFKVLIY